MDKLDLLVVVDPYPSATAAMAAMPGKAGRPQPQPGGLPAAGRDAVRGPTALYRFQPLAAMAREGHRSAVGEPRTDHMIMHQLAEKLGFGKELSKNLQDAEGQGHGRARGRGHPARDQCLGLDHRLHGPRAPSA